jgi:glycyl-tRNA synthetase
MLGLSPEELATAGRAATLAKADLATAMVIEMTSLQGVIGGQYALLSGESPAVARAIAEQYQPVSHSRPGLALALADRLDSLTGLTAAGLTPKGSNDPFALRRAAIQIVENLIENRVSFDLTAAIAGAAALLPVPADNSTCEETLAFIAGRLEVLLRDRGRPASIVRAVLAEQANNPYMADVTTAALVEATRLPDWSRLLDSYARCVRIVRSQPGQFTLRPDELTEPAEQSLYAAYQQALHRKDGAFSVFLASLRELEPAISRFFKDVLVMAEDTAIRENRLALLQGIAGLATGIADLSYLEGF